MQRKTEGEGNFNNVGFPGGPKGGGAPKEYQQEGSKELSSQGLIKSNGPELLGSNDVFGGLEAPHFDKFIEVLR